MALVFFVWEHRLFSLSMCTNGCHFHCTTNQKHYPNLGNDTSSVWNFCASSLDNISRGNQLLCPDKRKIQSRVYHKQQTWICITWPASHAFCSLFLPHITINSLMFVLFMTIVFGHFEIVIFCFVKFSTRIWCLQFAINISQISQNITFMKFPIF